MVQHTTMSFESLPQGTSPLPVAFPHFPDALHAVVWRNWDTVDVAHLASVLQATPEQIAGVAEAMGLPPQRSISAAEQRRNYMTIIRKNWHLLPYEQLCQLVGWDAARMNYALLEDDFMWTKLGGLKPRCPRVVYQPPDEATLRRQEQIRSTVQREAGVILEQPFEPPYGFIQRQRSDATQAITAPESFKIRMVYPYFLRYGDPLAESGIDDLPESYLAELVDCGVNAIWLQAVLYSLSPWALFSELSAGWERRLENLRRIVEYVGRFGIGVYLYFNEPRGLPEAQLERHPDLCGVGETPERRGILPANGSLCTSVPAVREFLSEAVSHVFRNVPGLAGAFAITFSEKW